MHSNDLIKMPEHKMLERINSAKFPQEMNAQEKRVLAIVAITYGFDPLMGEIMLYHGRPFVSIDGRYRKAQETGNLIGVKTYPASKQEKLDWEIPDGDYFFKSEVFVKGGGFNSFVGWGRVKASETAVQPGKEAYKPVQVNPQRMAEKRAEAQALRKAFHIPLPSIEEVGMVEEEVNQQPGEIIDVPKLAAPATPEEKTQAVKDINDLWDTPPAKPTNPATPPAKVENVTQFDRSKFMESIKTKIDAIHKIDMTFNYSKITGWLKDNGISAPPRTPLSEILDMASDNLLKSFVDWVGKEELKALNKVNK